MNISKAPVASNNTSLGKASKKSRALTGKPVDPKDSFSTTKTADDNRIYGPGSVKTGEQPKIKLSKRLMGAAKVGASGIGLGLAVGAIMTTLGGTIGAAIFGVGGILMGTGPALGIDALIGLGEIALTTNAALFGTIGAFVGFKDPLSDEEKKLAQPAPEQANQAATTPSKESVKESE